MLLKYFSRTSPFQYLLRANFQRPLLIFLFLLLLYSNEGGGKSADSLLSSNPNRHRRLQTGGHTSRIKNDNIDVVGFGEDCSVDGPFCDETHHLICDSEEETCVCNGAEGYVLVDQLADSSGLVYTTRRYICVRPGGHPLKTAKEQEKVLTTSSMRGKLFEPAIKTKKVTVEKVNPDIVGFGEDCSTDGPVCDKSQHLICDMEEETCICDGEGGYVHIDGVPGGREAHFGAEMDANGNVEMSSKHICVSRQEISDRVDELLGVTKKVGGGDNASPSAKPVPVIDSHSAREGYPVEEEIVEGSSSENKVESIYKDFMTTLDGDHHDPAQEERLEPFKLDRESSSKAKLSTKDLIAGEIVKYGGVWDFGGVKELDLIAQVLDSQLGWRGNKLSKQICAFVFDVDQDGLFTHQEYVITVLSEKIRKLVIPKTFYKLQNSLIDDRCIRINDLKDFQEPDMIQEDFDALDEDKDGCFSLPEFESAMDEVCRVSWLETIFKLAGILEYSKFLDPSPEEMYIRRIMQNERLNSNWKIVDKDGDDLISREELQSDLIALGHAFADSYEETDAMLDAIDYDQDGYISLKEAKATISFPSKLTEEYQFEWLESLYELFETDEDEVQEYLESLLKNFDEVSSTSVSKDEEVEDDPKLRTFLIFDKNRNGELDEVEFKLLLEIIRKYVVYTLLQETLASMDYDGDNKVNTFEYLAFFKNATSTFQIYFKNLMTRVLEGEEGFDLEVSDTDAEAMYDAENDEDVYENEDDDERDRINYKTVAPKTLTIKAASPNETLLIQGIFLRLDADSDGFITKEDLYAHVSSFKMTVSEFELEKEFAALDKNKDGLLTNEDSEMKEYLTPVTFEDYKSYAYLNDEVFPTDFEAQLALVDTNGDGVIQTDEFIYNKALLFAEEEPEFLFWVELHFGQPAPQTDPGGEKAFKEFDANFDGFISKAEFTKKLNETVGNSSALSKLSGSKDFTPYFTSLDLNRDGKVSYNEFHFLVLRSNRKINEK